MHRFALIALLLVPLACAAQEAGTVEKISPQDAAAQVSAGKAVLVDVRERNELDAGMAQGAHWYPTSSIQSDPNSFNEFLAHGGLGIGLALAKRLTELHGGVIEARSSGPGQGSEFIVRMPLTKAAVVEEPARPPVQPRVRRRALVIDDNRDAATTMAMFVEELGGTAWTAFDGASGLAAVETFRPDIVFMDIGMPGLDGYEVCRRIRQMPASQQMIVVAVTGWGQAQDKQRAFEVGFDAHLTKPVDPDALAQLLAGAAV